MAESLNAQAIANLVVHVGLDDSKVSVGLKAMQNSVRAVTTQWRAQFAIFNQLGDHVGAAKAKYDGLTESLKRQQGVVEEQRSQLKAMGQRTSENAASYDKLTAQINLNANKLASLVEQQKKAGQMYEFEKTGIRGDKEELSLLQREMESTVKMYQAQGKEQDANKLKSEGLRTQIEKLTEVQGKEQTILERIKAESGENSREYREQAIRVNELSTKVAHAKNEFDSLGKSASGSASKLQKMKERALSAKDVFKGSFLGSLAGNAVTNMLATVQNGIHGIISAGKEENVTLESIGLSWKNLGMNNKQVNEMTEAVEKMHEQSHYSLTGINALSKAAYSLTKNKEGMEQLATSIQAVGRAKGLDEGKMQQVTKRLQQVGISGKVTYSDVAKMTRTLPGFSTAMAQTMGVSADKLVEMGKKGKLTQKDFVETINAMGKANAGSFANYEHTTSGFSAVMHDTWDKLSAHLMKPIFNSRKSGLADLTKMVQSKDIQEGAEDIGKGLSQLMSIATKQLQKFAQYAQTHKKELKDDLQAVKGAVTETWSVVKPVIDWLVDHPKVLAGVTVGLIGMKTHLIPVRTLFKDLGGVVRGTSSAFKYMAKEGTLGNKAILGLGKGIKGLGKWTGKGIVSGIKGIGSASKASVNFIGSMTKSTLSFGKTAAIWTAQRLKILAVATAQKTAALASKAWTIAQRALNIVLKANPIGLIITAVGLLVTGFIALYKHNKQFRDFINGIWDVIKKIFGGLGKWFKGIWNGITSGVKNFVGGIKEKFSDMKQGVSDHAKNMANSAKNNFNNMKKWSVDATKKMADQIMDKHSWLNKHTNGAASTMFTGLKKTFKSGHKTMEDATQTFQDLIHGKWSKLGSDMKKTSGSAMSTVKSYFRTGYNTLNSLTGGRLGDMFDKVKSIGGKIVNYFKKLPHRMASGIKNGWDAIKQAFIDLGNGMLSGIGKGVNGVIGGINWILGKIHVPKLKKWKVPQYAMGGKAAGLAIVGEKNKHELIKYADGHIEVSPNRATLYNFKKPVSILGGDKTEQLMKSGIIPQFGLGNWLGSAMDFVKGGFSSISKGASGFWNAVTHPSELLNTAVDKFTDLSGLNGTIADMAKGTVTYATKSALSWIKDKLSLQDDPGGSGVERWRPYVVRALAMNDLSTSGSMVNKVLRQIATESGGNAHAVQHGYTDVNTLSGDLAKGLMQTISATFNAYKFPGHEDIFKGFDNLLASLNYAKHRYGPSLSALGKGRGYANGAIVAQEQFAHIAEGNKPEAIIPLTNQNRAIQLMYQVLDYLSNKQGGKNSGGFNAAFDNSSNDKLLAAMEQNNKLLSLLIQVVQALHLNIDLTSLAKGLNSTNGSLASMLDFQSIGGGN